METSNLSRSSNARRSLPLIIIAGALLLCAVSSVSRAALVPVDYVPGSGDGLITLDTETTLEWLDLSLTHGISVDDALNGYAVDGFRLANINEVTSLWAAVGIPFEGFAYTPLYYTGAASLESLLIGDTSLLESIVGYLDALAGFPDAVTDARMYIHHGSMDVQTFVSVVNTISTDQVFPYHSSYLVRGEVVPIPASVWLFGSGLLGLVGVARRKRAA